MMGIIEVKVSKELKKMRELAKQIPGSTFVQADGTCRTNTLLHQFLRAAGLFPDDGLWN
jgi:hypothetical protein